MTERPHVYAFATIIRAISDLTKIQNPDFAKTLHSLEDAAISMLPHMSMEGTDGVMHVAWDCGSQRLIDALPTSPANLYERYDGDWVALGERTSVPYLISLERAGMIISGVAKTLAKRAIVGNEPDVQDFLMARIETMSPIRRVFVSNLINGTTNPEFTAKYCLAMIEANQTTAKHVLANCIQRRRGHPTVGLILAGAEIEDDATLHLPDFARDRIKALQSAHGHLQFISTFGTFEEYCASPVKQELADSLFEREFAVLR